MLKTAAAAALCAALAACASGSKEFAEAAPPRAPSEDESGRILSYARDLRKVKGCAEAAASYRVVAAMGEGLEPAQHELGECLLTMSGASEAETALFREEAFFWLTRAAWAGNARAQRTLATLYGARGSAYGSEQEALKWALVYQKNGAADLYGFKDLPSTFVPGLKNSLDTDEIAAAETFAGEFRPIHLGIYSSPPRRRTERQGRGERRDGPPGGERRRRR